MAGSARRWLLPAAYAAVLAAGYALVFVVPWHVAPSAPSDSDSYAVGFSNRASLLGALLTAAALFALSSATSARESGSLVRLSRPERGEGVPWWLVGLLLAVTVVSAVFFAWISYGSWRYGEKNYFLDRLAYLVNGDAPFRDVEFTYGPLLAYLPLLAWRALRPLGIPAEAAYDAVYVLLFSAGVPLLAYSVGRVRLTRRQRAALFAAIGAPVAINETVGINGLLVRFLLPVAALLFFHTRAVAATSRAGRPAFLRLAAWAIAVPAACFAVSPEVGIAAFAGIAVYLGWLAVAMRRREAAWALSALPLSAAVAAAATGGASLTHLLGMAGGALNFPVLPSPAVLLLLGALLASAALLPRFVSRSEPATPALLALGAAGVVMLAGALGRADTSHVYFYGLAVAFLAAPLLAAVRGRAFALWVVAFAAVFVAAHWLILHYDYGHMIVQAAGRTPGMPRAAAGRVALAVGWARGDGWAAWERGARAPVEPDLAALARYRPLAAPLGFADGTGLALAERGWLGSPYFRGVPFTRKQLDTMERHLDRADHILLDKATAAALRGGRSPAPGRSVGAKNFVRLMWPESFPRVNETPDLAQELREYLAKHYRAAAETGRYTVLERKE